MKMMPKVIPKLLLMILSLTYSGEAYSEPCQTSQKALSWLFRGFLNTFSKPIILSKKAEV